MGRILLFYEDEYGKDFYKNLIKELKNKTIIDKGIGIKYNHIGAFCNPKIMKMIKAQEIKAEYDKIIIIFDGDFIPDQKKESMSGHIHKNYTKKVKIITFESEIEELICISQGWKYSGKPSDYLKQKIDYEKRNLPEMIKYIKIDVLKSNSLVFNEFLKSINR